MFKHFKYKLRDFNETLIALNILKPTIFLLGNNEILHSPYGGTCAYLTSKYGDISE